MKNRAAGLMTMGGTMVTFLLTCSTPSHAPEKPSLAPIADTSVFATDTVQLSAAADFAPAPIRCYIWSSDGGKTYPESTHVNSIAKCWGLADTGVHHLAVKVLDSRGIVSDSVACAVSVVACKPILTLIGDTVIDFHYPIVLRVANSSGCRRILSYMWSFDGALSFPDTTRDSTINKQWTIADTGKTIHVVCRAQVIPGLVSQDARATIHIGYCRPAIVLSGATEIHTGDTTRFYIVFMTPCPTAFYLWSFDNGVSYTDTTYTPSIVKRWQTRDTALTRVVAAAMTPDGILSAPDTLHLFAALCLPTVRLSADSVAFTGDSSHLVASASSSCSPIAWYIWSFNGGTSYSDTVRTATMVKQWNPSDVGTRFIFVKVQTTSGAFSLPDSCTIAVRSSNPKVSLPADTSIAAGDTLIIVARLDSSHRPIADFAWTVDHSAQEIVTNGNRLAYACSPEQAGAHSVSVRAIDSKGFSSPSDSMTITSVIVSPTLIVPRDTLLKRNDTLTAVVTASVAGGAIKQYVWNVGSYYWTDSGASAQKKIWYQGKDTVSVLVGVRDNRGVVKIDSFHVYFNAPPANLQMAYPRVGDTIIFHNLDSTFKRGMISFRFSATDKNGPQDTLTYRLSLGKLPTSLTKVYEGRDSVWTNASPLDTSYYYWTLSVRDRLGDSAQTGGGFTCLLQQTICFAGHSIIVGFMDSAVGMGGMRGRILPVMRSRRGGTVKFKPIGPFTTGFMANKQDDSCFAVASYRAKDLWLLVRNTFQTLTADLWVVMLGVNDGYSLNNEFRPLIGIIDTIHARNPQSYTYVINGLPNTGTAGQDKIFNGWLADSIKARKAANPSWNLWNINAFKKFTLADTTTPNPALFFAQETPLLHPNAAGYDTLSKMILDTMKLKFP